MKWIMEREIEWQWISNIKAPQLPKSLNSPPLSLGVTGEHWDGEVWIVSQ